MNDANSPENEPDLELVSESTIIQVLNEAFSLMTERRRNLAASLAPAEAPVEPPPPQPAAQEVEAPARQVATPRAAQRVITVYVSEEKFRALNMARRAIPNPETWSMLGNRLMDEWLDSLPEDIFHFPR